MLAHLSFIGYAIWGLFRPGAGRALVVLLCSESDAFSVFGRNTVLKHLLLKVEIWPERMLGP